METNDPNAILHKGFSYNSLRNTVGLEGEEIRVPISEQKKAVARELISELIYQY
jgi:hypothetical protein